MINKMRRISLKFDRLMLSIGFFIPDYHKEILTRSMSFLRGKMLYASSEYNTKHQNVAATIAGLNCVSTVQYDIKKGGRRSMVCEASTDEDHKIYLYNCERMIYAENC